MKKPIAFVKPDFTENPGGISREQAIDIVNKIRIAAGGEALTEEEIAASDARVAARKAEKASQAQEAQEQ